MLPLSGEDVTLHVPTTGSSFRVSAYRVGWYRGAQARLVWRSDEIRGRQREVSFAYATRTVDTRWAPLLTGGWPEGAYLLRLDASHGHQRYVPLIVRSADGAGKTVIVHAPETWQAYNLWGGYDLYQGEDGSYGTRSLQVSFNRPYEGDGASRFMIYERAFVVLAERTGIPLAYTTGVDIDRDPSVLRGTTSTGRREGARPSPGPGTSAPTWLSWARTPATAGSGSPRTAEPRTVRSCAIRPTSAGPDVLRRPRAGHHRLPAATGPRPGIVADRRRLRGLPGRRALR